jgi:hypothetical protein
MRQMQLQTGATDRRATIRPDADGQTPSQLVTAILGCYREMPGLCLRLDQAAKLFDLTPETCQVVLDDLVRAQHLRCDARGQYIR